MCLVWVCAYRCNHGERFFIAMHLAPWRVMKITILGICHSFAHLLNKLPESKSKSLTKQSQGNQDRGVARSLGWQPGGRGVRLQCILTLPLALPRQQNPFPAPGKRCRFCFHPTSHLSGSQTLQHTKKPVSNHRHNIPPPNASLFVDLLFILVCVCACAYTCVHMHHI